MAQPTLQKSLLAAPGWGVAWQGREFLSIASDDMFWGSSLHLLGLRSTAYKIMLSISLIMGEDWARSLD